MNSYLNPLTRSPCADPFVLKYLGEYWCYATGRAADGRFFSILHSKDLVHWRAVGGALARLAADTLAYPDTCYWAPEVVYDNGRFNMYYSVGNETEMQIRCATAESPAGPFLDAGIRLTQEPFAIDAHVFVDDDGQRSLFYATDFLDVQRVGTGIVMDRMLDPYQLAGTPRPVIRARYDWQIYDPCRLEKQGACWHTLEGPFVLKHAGLYYQMFSAGNWQNSSYGVAYAVTDRLDAPGEWHQPCDDVQMQPVLRSLPEAGVIGPGHNSVMRGPDNRELFCVYHRWDGEVGARVLAIDRMGWNGTRLEVYGPSFTPQPAPRRPEVEGFDGMRPLSGEWRIQSDRAVVVGGPASAGLGLPAEEFLLEVSLHGESQGEYGIEIAGDDEVTLRVSIQPEQGRMRISHDDGEELVPLPEGFDARVYHLLRLERSEGGIEVQLDGPWLAWRGRTAQPGRTLRLWSTSPAGFAGLAITTSHSG